jgi:poly(3-hydroxybutyrate) depolymerase
MVGSIKVAICLLATAASVWSSPVSLRTNGCGKNLPSGQTEGSTSNVTITSSGLERSYLIFIPPNYSFHAETPIIFSYHGGDRTAEDQLELDELTSPEFNTHALVVYPQGINVSS